MEFKKICLNVGGKLTETTLDTLKCCKRLYNYVINVDKTNDNSPIFIDRDYAVFERTLKFLRGYPVYKQLLNDDDVIHELIYWQHDLVFQQLPGCVKKSIKTYIEYNDKKNAHLICTVDFDNIEIPKPFGDDDEYVFWINTPNVNHLNFYKHTHYFVPKSVATKLLNIKKSPDCDIVCSERWKDHVWMEKNQLKLSLYKLKLKQILFSTNEWCICDKCTHHITPHV